MNSLGSSGFKDRMRHVIPNASTPTASRTFCVLIRPHATDWRATFESGLRRPSSSCFAREAQKRLLAEMSRSV